MRYMIDNAFVVEIVHCKVNFFLVISDSLFISLFIKEWVIQKKIDKM